MKTELQLGPLPKSRYLSKWHARGSKLKKISCYSASEQSQNMKLLSVVITTDLFMLEDLAVERQICITLNLLMFQAIFMRNTSPIALIIPLLHISIA